LQLLPYDNIVTSTSAPWWPIFANILNLKQWVLDVCKKWSMHAEAEDILKTQCNAQLRFALDALEAVEFSSK